MTGNTTEIPVVSVSLVTYFKYSLKWLSGEPIAQAEVRFLFLHRSIYYFK